MISPTYSWNRRPSTTLAKRVRSRRAQRSGGGPRRAFGLPAVLAATALTAAPLGGVPHAPPADGGTAGERADARSAPAPVAEPQTAGCSPTGTALQFDGGYKVGMCYVTPDGTVGQAKAGVWASGQSGLLWFFDRGNAEVLVKVLDGCEHTGYRWAFVAPVTTLEFNLEVTAPNGKKWTHTNEQGTTASTRSDTRAFRCADESASGAGAGAAVPGTVPWVPWPPSVADAVTRPPSVADMAPGAGPSLAEPQTGGCTPTGAALEFDGGYKVSMCYVTPDGTVGSAKSGIWASSQSGLLWFFDRGNAEVLVKVLDGCSNNGFRWVFVAPVTTLEFNLVVTGPYGKTWTHSNAQGETAATKSDVTAFLCTVDASASTSRSMRRTRIRPGSLTPAASSTCRTRRTARSTPTTAPGRGRLRRTSRSTRRTRMRPNRVRGWLLLCDGSRGPQGVRVPW